MNKTLKKSLYLYGCRGYAYNIFTENIKGNKEKLIKYFVNSKQPTNKEGTINISNTTIYYKDLKNIKGNITDNDLKDNTFLIEIYKKGYNIPRLSFVLKNNFVYVSWSKQRCELKNKFMKHTLKNNKINLNTKKVKVTNIYEKLNQLIKEPSYLLLNELFKFNKSYLKDETVDDWLKSFKNSRIILYSINRIE
jgi:hypothetical protein